MTAVSPLVFPGSRTLASWWNHLTPLQPRRFWVAHLLLHRIEALVALQLLSHLDPLGLFVLRAIALSGRASLQDLDERLHLGLPLLRRLVGRLEGEKLTRSTEATAWLLTDLGRQVLDKGSYTRVSEERRAFYFVHNEQPVRPPHFLNLRTDRAALVSAGVDGWKFEPSSLQACLAKPVEWKQRFGFPTEVQQILSGTPEETAMASPG